MEHKWIILKDLLHTYKESLSIKLQWGQKKPHKVVHISCRLYSSSEWSGSQNQISNNPILKLTANWSFKKISDLHFCQLFWQHYYFSLYQQYLLHSQIHQKMLYKLLCTSNESKTGFVCTREKLYVFVTNSFVPWENVFNLTQSKILM